MTKFFHFPRTRNAPSAVTSNTPVTSTRVRNRSIVNRLFSWLLPAEPPASAPRSRPARSTAAAPSPPKPSPPPPPTQSVAAHSLPHAAHPPDPAAHLLRETVHPIQDRFECA